MQPKVVHKYHDVNMIIMQFKCLNDNVILGTNIIKLSFVPYFACHEVSFAVHKTDTIKCHMEFIVRSVST